MDHISFQEGPLPTPLDTSTGSTADVHAAGVVASIVSFVTWVLGRYVFRGQVPPEVTGIILLTIPYGLAMLGAYAVRRRMLRAARDAAYIRSLGGPSTPPPGTV